MEVPTIQVSLGKNIPKITPIIIHKTTIIICINFCFEESIIAKNK